MKRDRNSQVVTALAISLSISSLQLNAAEKPSSMNEGFNISPTEVPKLEHNALLGSGDAAYRLSQYDYFVSLNEADGFRWLQVAAEDGNATAQYSLGSRLRDSEGPQDKLRACFWFKQAKVNGSGQVAALATRQLDALDSSCTSN